MMDKYMFGGQGAAGHMSLGSNRDDYQKSADRGGSLTVNNTYQGFNPTPAVQDQVKTIARQSPSAGAASGALPSLHAS